MELVLCEECQVKSNKSSKMISEYLANNPGERIPPDDCILKVWVDYCAECSWKFEKLTSIVVDNAIKRIEEEKDEN